MLALLAVHRAHTARLRSALPPGQEVVPVSDWEHLERVAPSAECTVVHIDRLRGSPALEKLSGFKARNPDHPLVLVTAWEPENARSLKDVVAEEVVWEHEVEGDLSAAVQRACEADFHYVRCLAVPFQEAMRLPPALREALAYACRSDRPVHSVNQLAAVTGQTRTTLWSQWKKAVAPSPLRLQDFLHWLLLLRVMGHKAPGQTWAAAAEETGVHPHTLARYAKQLTGRTLVGIAGSEAEITRLFQERVLAFLLDGRELNIL